MRRPTEIDPEEEELRWVLAFAKNHVERADAQRELNEYLERKKKSYIEK